VILSSIKDLFESRCLNQRFYDNASSCPTPFTLIPHPLALRLEYVKYNHFKGPNQAIVLVRLGKVGGFFGLPEIQANMDVIWREGRAAREGGKFNTKLSKAIDLIIQHMFTKWGTCFIKF
jgi:hypothetical protein